MALVEDPKFKEFVCTLSRNREDLHNPRDTPSLRWSSMPRTRVLSLMISRRPRLMMHAVPLGVHAAKRQ